MRSLFARSLMTVMTLGTLAVSHPATAQTESNTETPVLLYGNEGLGIGNLTLGGIIPASTGYNHPTLAQGFKVGNTGYIMTTVDVGLVMPASTITAITNGTFSLDIALFSSVEDTNGKQVPGERLVTFNPVPTSGSFVPFVKTLYTFGYLDATQSNKVTLEANKSYWVIVSYIPQASSSSSPAFSWSFATPSSTNLPEQETPVEKNTSGLTYVGTIGQHNFGDDWVDHGDTSSFPNSGLRFGISGYEAPVIIGGGGGGAEQTPPTLDCYALSKGFFKNNFSGWPTLIASQGTEIEGELYSVAKLQAMLSAKTTRGNQIGQLASQLVAVHLSRALAVQTAGEPYSLWDGWAPDSAEAQAAYKQAAALVNANIVFETHRGSLRVSSAGCVTNVGDLIAALDGYISDNHCSDGSGSGSDDDDDRSCRRGGSKRDRDRDRCNKKLKYERRDNRKTHECR